MGTSKPPAESSWVAAADVMVLPFAGTRVEAASGSFTRCLGCVAYGRALWRVEGDF